MKQNKNRKVSLKLMDLTVSIEGSRNVEMKAVSLMQALIEARLKFNELLDEGMEANEPHAAVQKRKEIEIDRMFT